MLNKNPIYRKVCDPNNEMTKKVTWVCNIQNDPPSIK